jgi:hypothetical protein
MSDNATHQNNPTIQREFALSLLGDIIGAGIGRRVFENSLDKSLVFKVEDCNGSRFQNVLEWETWQNAKGTKLERWLAPCDWISHSGSILLQRRTTPAFKYPPRLPAFLTDTKRSNYGMLNGKFVCHDYGTNVAMSLGLVQRERKAEWWD